MAKGIGWRGSAYTVAGYGLLLAVLVRLTVKEPARAPAATPAAASNRSGSHAPESDGDKDFTIKER